MIRTARRIFQLSPLSHQLNIRRLNFISSSYGVIHSQIQKTWVSNFVLHFMLHFQSKQYTTHSSRNAQGTVKRTVAVHCAVRMTPRTVRSTDLSYHVANFFVPCIKLEAYKYISSCIFFCYLQIVDFPSWCSAHFVHQHSKVNRLLHCRSHHSDLSTFNSTTTSSPKLQVVCAIFHL